MAKNTQDQALFRKRLLSHLRRIDFQDSDIVIPSDSTRRVIASVRGTLAELNVTHVGSSNKFRLRDTTHAREPSYAVGAVEPERHPSRSQEIVGLLLILGGQFRAPRPSV